MRPWTRLASPSKTSTQWASGARTTPGIRWTPAPCWPTARASTDPAQLRATLAARGEQFVETFTEKLLTYALGRGIEPYDRPVIRNIVREAAAHDYRWSAIILGIARSTPFQMRRSES